MDEFDRQCELWACDRLKSTLFENCMKMFCQLTERRVPVKDLTDPWTDSGF